MIPGSLLALHGFLGHPDAFAELALTEHFERVEVPTMLGHGPAPHPPAPDFAAEVGRLLDLAETLPTPRRLLGYSQGARVALGLLAEHSQLFHSALLVAPQPGYQTPEERLARRAVEDRWIAELEDEGVDAFVDRFSQLPLFGPPRQNDRSERPDRYRHTADGLVTALLVLGASQMPNLWPSLPGIRCPVELWVGALDGKFEAIAEDMRSSLPQARLVRFPAAHHNPILDAPDAAREALSAWLQA